MRADAEPIVERLRSVRHLPWLRIIDDADLDSPVEQEADPETVIGPYQWLIKRVGDGLKLTQAGYLPPAIVVEALDALGWRTDWYGKNNREEHSRPLLELRESAQRDRLLRKNPRPVAGDQVGEPAGRRSAVQLHVTVPYGNLEHADGEPIEDEDMFTVGQAIVGAREFSHDYDVGDGWTHDIRVEQVIDTVGAGTPHLVGGARACPREDSGGPSGYAEKLKVRADPRHEHHDLVVEWLGEGFDPEALDLEAINADRELIDRVTQRRRTGS